MVKKIAFSVGCSLYIPLQTLKNHSQSFLSEIMMFLRQFHLWTIFAISIRTKKSKFLSLETLLFNHSGFKFSLLRIRVKKCWCVFSCVSSSTVNSFFLVFFKGLDNQISIPGKIQGCIFSSKIYFFKIFFAENYFSWKIYYFLGKKY